MWPSRHARTGVLGGASYRRVPAFRFLRQVRCRLGNRKRLAMAPLRETSDDRLDFGVIRLGRERPLELELDLFLVLAAFVFD